jgi:dihydrofolate synthase/folylpolyglutamate synthase
MNGISQRKRQLLDQLFSFHRFGIKPGLERTRELLRLLGDPHVNQKYIHVAGTNGKGSVCSMTASILSSSGYKTGLYTSPHLIDFNERIRIDGVQISDEEIVELCETILPIAKDLDCTFFEITTAMAFLYFKSKDVDFAVIETGMGGRFDSTNVIMPKVCAITQIDIDHCEYLGDTLEKIAFEKAGIVKPLVPLVVSDIHTELESIFLDSANKMKAPTLFVADWIDAENIRIDDKLNMIVDISSPDFHFNNLELEKAGPKQINNLKAVLSIVNYLSRDYNIDENSIRKGLKNLKSSTGLTGRMETLRVDPPFIMDVAHNPASANSLVETLKMSPYRYTKFNIVFGVMADKDVKSIIKILSPLVAKLILTKPKTERAASLEILTKIAREAIDCELISIESVPDAISAAIECGEPCIVVGSFYTAGEALEYINEHNIFNS